MQGVLASHPEMVDQPLRHELLDGHHHRGHHHGIGMDHPILALNMTIVSICVKEGYRVNLYLYLGSNSVLLLFFICSILYASIFISYNYPNGLFYGSYKTIWAAEMNNILCLALFKVISSITLHAINFIHHRFMHLWPLLAVPLLSFNFNCITWHWCNYWSSPCPSELYQLLVSSPSTCWWTFVLR